MSTIGADPVCALVHAFERLVDLVHAVAGLVDRGKQLGAFLGRLPRVGEAVVADVQVLDRVPIGVGPMLLEQRDV